MTEELITLDELAAKVKLSRRQVRDVLVKRKDFPPPAVTLSQKTRRWRVQDVERWMGVHK